MKNIKIKKRFILKMVLMYVLKKGLIPSNFISLSENIGFSKIFPFISLNNYHIELKFMVW